MVVLNRVQCGPGGLSFTFPASELLTVDVPRRSRDNLREILTENTLEEEMIHLVGE